MHGEQHLSNLFVIYLISVLEKKRCYFQSLKILPPSFVLPYNFNPIFNDKLLKSFSVLNSLGSVCRSLLFIPLKQVTSKPMTFFQ